MHASRVAAVFAISASSLATIAFGDVVVPANYASVDAPGTFLGPTSSGVRRYQQLMDSSTLTGILGQSIVGVQWRLNGNATVAFPTSDSIYSDYDIYVGPGVDPSARSLTFASNLAGPQTQVRDGALTFPAGSFGAAVGGVAPFGPVVSFDTPYVYTGGDLLVELRHSTSSGPSASSDAALASSDPGYDVLFGATWDSSLTDTEGLRANFAVINLVTPEPTSAGALLIAGTLLGRRRR